MNDSKIFNRYDEYVRCLTLAELESIYQDIDRENHPDRYKIVLAELNARYKKQGFENRIIDENSEEESYSDRVIGLILFLGLLILEIYLGDDKYSGSSIPQIIRFALILSVGFVGAIYTHKEGDYSIKPTLIFLSIGFVIVLIAVVPRLLDRGLENTVDMILLKQSIIGSFRNWGFSSRSNFTLSIGYTFIAWAFIDNLLRIFKINKKIT